MRLHWDPVKLSPESTSPKGIWTRWLEGWELIVPSVGVAALSLWLALPQPTLPEHLPLPTLAPAAVEEARTRLVAQATAAKHAPLPFEIRAVGERFRQIGRSVRAGNALTLDVQSRYREQVTNALKTNASELLLRLRAIQTELFVLALSAYEHEGLENDDLKDLGGDVLEIAKERHLIKAVSPKRHRPIRVLLDDDERRAIFLLRWTDLAGLSDTPDFRLAPSWILLASQMRLRAPVSKLGAAELKVIERVATVDPDYPSAVAKGIVFAKLGDYAAAAESFRQYVELHPDAPYTNRAKNHLLYVSQHLGPFGQ